MANKVLRPYVVGDNDDWTEMLILWPGTGSKITFMDPGDPPVPDTSTYIYTSAANVQEFKPDKTFPENMDLVASVTVKVNVATIGGGSSVRFVLIDSLGTHTGSPFAPASTPTTYTLVRSQMSNDSTAWSEAALRHADFAFGIESLNANHTRAYAEWAEVSYEADVDVDPFPRQIVSQMVHEFGMRHGLVKLNLPIEALDMRYMDNFFLTHPEGPHPDGEGWKDLDWQRRLLRLFGVQFDPDGDLESVHAIALDLRKYIAYLRDTSVSPYSIASAEDEVDGPLRLDLGLDRAFVRATVATDVDVSGLVVQVTSGTERIGPNGVLIEDFRKNFAKESSFKVWTGGASAAPDEWTEVDGDANLTISQETNGVFDPNLSTYACKLVSSNGAGGDYGLNQVATFAWESDNNGVLSIDWEDHSSQGLVLGLRRNSDNWWWNPSTEVWQSSQPSAATMRLSVPPSGTIVRDYMPFDLGTGSYTGTYLIYIRVDLALQEATLHNVQLEGGDQSLGESGLWYPTSRIITQSASAVPRIKDTYTITTNPTERRIVHPDHGTLFCKLKVDYAHAALADTYMGAQAQRDVAILQANMWTPSDFILSYDTGNSRFEFQYRATVAYAGSALTAGEYVFALRWTSDHNELGLPNYSTDLFVNGVKGTGDTLGTPRTEYDGATSFFYGQQSNMTDFNRINGWISRYFSTPIVLTDEEVKAWTDRIT